MKLDVSKSPPRGGEAGKLTSRYQNMLLTGRVSCKFLAKIFTMARVGIVFGLLLCGLTYAAMVWDPEKIPAIHHDVWNSTAVLRVVALNPHRRKHPCRLQPRLPLSGRRNVVVHDPWGSIGDGKAGQHMGMTVIGIMSLLCVVFVALWLSGLFQMRRRQAAGGPFPSGTRPVGSNAGKSIDEAAGNKSDPEE